MQTISHDTHATETNLKSEINDLTVHLEVLAAKKRRLTLNYRAQQELNQKKLKELQTELSGVRREIDQSFSFNPDTSACSDFAEEVRPFLASLKPLEQALQLVTEEKTQVEQSFASHSERLARLEDEHARLTRERQNNLEHANKLKNNLLHHERAFAEVKETHPLEFNEVVREIETKRQIQAIQDKKAKQAGQLNATDRRIAEIDRDFSKGCEDLERWQRHRNLGSSPDDVPLLEQEHRLALQCYDLGLIPLSKAVEQAAEERRIDILACIKREQSKLIEDRERQLKEKVRLQNLAFEKKIQEVTQIVQRQRETSDPMLVDAQQSLRLLKSQARVFNARHSCIFGSIKQWKKANKHLQTTSEPLHWPTDAEILNEFRTEMKNSVWKADSFASLESLLNSYIKELAQRKGLTNLSTGFEIKSTAEIKQQKKHLQMLDSQRKALKSERDGIHHEFLSLVDFEKTTRKKLNKLKEESESERQRQIEETLRVALKPKFAERKKIQRRFNEAAQRRLYNQEYARLKSEAEQAKDATHKKIADLYSSKSYWEAQISEFTSKVQPEMLDQLQGDIQNVQAQVYSFQQQLHIITSAEDELNAKLESMLEAKKREVSRHHSKLLCDSGPGPDPTKLDQLHMEYNTKTETLQQAEAANLQAQQDYQEQLQVLKQTEADCKERLTELHQEYKQMEQQKNKAQRLRLKLRELEKEMAVFGLAHLEREDFLDTAQSDDHKELSPSSSGMIEEDSSDSDSEEAQVLIKKLKLEINVPGKTTEFLGTVMSPLTFSPQPDEQLLALTDYCIITEELTHDELDAITALTPLLNGCELYKKFSKSASTRQVEFDPLLAHKAPIENCGYGRRLFRLNRQLTRIEIRRPKCFARPELNQRHGAGVESSISIAQLRKPIIPRHTMEILKSQKRHWLKNQPDDDPAHEEAYAEMKKAGVMVYQDPAFQAMSRSAKFYPFFMCMEGAGRVEVVADSYIAFKQWVDGLNVLFKSKKMLARLKHHLQPRN